MGMAASSAAFICRSSPGSTIAELAEHQPPSLDSAKTTTAVVIIKEREE